MYYMAWSRNKCNYDYENVEDHYVDDKPGAEICK